MKKILIALMISGLVFGTVASAEARDHGRSHRSARHGYYHHSHSDLNTAGAIIAGIVTVGLLAEAFSDPAPVYTVPPAVVYTPSRWIAGHYETVQQQVWVPGGNRKVWVEPVYERRFMNGIWTQVLVRDGYYMYQYIAGHYEVQNVQRWVEGYWTAC
ncbi:MAG: hypothetical protein JW774_07620 [Candidatus Aureabacteria bacterium]|nr:hypothetical protein [Candidatus Auribacterota bacterium]